MLPRQICRPLALLAGIWLVHAGFATAVLPVQGQTQDQKQGQKQRQASGQPAPRQLSLQLPIAVGEMRDAILEAVQSGRLEDLKVAADLNELKPEWAAGPVPDPISFWRQQSGDGTGAALLGVIGQLLEGPHAVAPLGKDAENSRQFIWPALADKTWAELTEAELAQLKALEPEARIEAMRLKGKYLGWRIVIGADGVWHSFRRYD